MLCYASAVMYAYQIRKIGASNGESDDVAP